MSVWGIGGDSEKTAHVLIHLGVDGIITKHLEASAQVFVQNTFTMLGEEWNVVAGPLEVKVSN